YDCGACSGRPGSVNARAFCEMANHPEVRKLLAGRGFTIPEGTLFVAGLHDTSRDEFTFYGEASLPAPHAEAHARHAQAIARALDLNAKERSRRFESIDTRAEPAEIHRRVRVRTVSLFEPRPELNHATNSLCIVGRREVTDHLFLERRSFLNSYDWRVDPEGKFLLGILNAAAPVCGGINLEYYFSRVDNQVLGAGTKLPHNVMGLIGVSNGMEGDLRPGLPSQMIEVHDPVRLLIIVEQVPAVVLATLRTNPATWEWFDKEWVHLAVLDPRDGSLHRFEHGGLVPYEPLRREVPVVEDLPRLLEENAENIPVMHLSPAAAKVHGGRA
ncbi:MAG: putative inorganic carbon transporter subunit DabA, partial [Planctomycetota bacterium]